jgi:TRAP-type C4-dicarboxylate transport system permease small subunit
MQLGSVAPIETKAPDENLSGYNGVEDWISLSLFLALCFVVFLQFFTRYVLNNSFGWTEEVARYLLIGTVFTGAAMCMRRHRHIQVNFLYRLLPKRVGFLLARLVDIVVVLFLAYATWLTWQLMKVIGDDQMTLVKLPMNVIYVFVLGGLGVGTIRAVQVTIQHFRDGYGALERPDLFIEENASDDASPKSGAGI